MSVPACFLVVPFSYRWRWVCPWDPWPSDRPVMPKSSPQNQNSGFPYPQQHHRTPLQILKSKEFISFSNTSCESPGLKLSVRNFKCLFANYTAYLLGFNVVTMPACSSGTLTNVLPHRNAMPQTQIMTLQLVTVYRHRAYLLLCDSLIWNVTLEYTTPYSNVLGQAWLGNPSPTFHTHQRVLNFMMLSLWYVVRSLVESVPYPLSFEPGPVVCESITLSAHP